MDKELEKIINDFQFDIKKLIRESQDVDKMNTLAYIAVERIILAYEKGKK